MLLMEEPGGPALQRPVVLWGSLGGGWCGCVPRGLGTFRSMAGLLRTEEMAVVPLGAELSVILVFNLCLFCSF